MSEPLRPLRPRDLLLAAAVGTAAALVCAWAYAVPGPAHSDFEYWWRGAWGLVHGRDPYRTVLADSGLVSPLYYPMPAVLVTAPLGLLPFAVARPVWAGCSAFALALAGLRQREHVLLVALLSGSFWSAFIIGQWSPLLTAGAVLPWLGALWIAKPSIGLAFAVAYPSRRACAGMLALVALSCLVLPGWLGEWRASLGHAIHVAPLMRPGGFLLLLALRKWRRPEARLLAALACVPHMTVLYETLPLFLVARRRAEAYLLAALTMVCAAVQARLYPGTAVVSNVDERWPILFVLVYLPALVLVLRRPNEGALPAWMERALDRLRSRPVAA